MQKGRNNMKLTIEGMMCMHCAARVKKALEGIQGVSAEVDLESKTASVTCPEGTDPALLKAAVEKAGYTMTSIQ